MSPDEYYDPVECAELQAEDEVLADLMTEYMDRRENGVVTVFPDLQACAHEHGARMAENFETLVVYWELKRAQGEA